jgi:hypothetical protein
MSGSAHPLLPFAAQRRAFGMCREAVDRLQAAFFTGSASAAGDCQVSDSLLAGSPVGDFGGARPQKLTFAASSVFLNLSH